MTEFGANCEYGFSQKNWDNGKGNIRVYGMGKIENHNNTFTGWI